MILPCNGLAAFTKKHSDTPTPYSRLRPNVERRTMNESGSHHIGRTTNETIHRRQFGCFYPKHNDYKNHSPEPMTLSTTRQISRLKTLRPNGLVIRKEQGASPLQDEDVHQHNIIQDNSSLQRRGSIMRHKTSCPRLQFGKQGDGHRTRRSDRRELLD
jgi:hypothetical protein